MIHISDLLDFFWGEIMDREVHEIRLAQWKKIIQDANTSGLSKKDWCAVHGYSMKQFYYWQRKVRKSIIEETRNKGELQLPGFAELKVPCQETSYNEGDSSPEARDGSMALQPEMVLMTAGCSILIGSQITEQALTTVLKAIRNA